MSMTTVRAPVLVFLARNADILALARQYSWESWAGTDSPAHRQMSHQRFECGEVDGLVISYAFCTGYRFHRTGVTTVLINTPGVTAQELGQAAHRAPGNVIVRNSLIEVGFEVPTQTQVVAGPKTCDCDLLTVLMHEGCQCGGT